MQTNPTFGDLLIGLFSVLQTIWVSDRDWACKFLRRIRYLCQFRADGGRPELCPRFRAVDDGLGHSGSRQLCLSTSVSVYCPRNEYPGDRHPRKSFGEYRVHSPIVSTHGQHIIEDTYHSWRWIGQCFI